MGDVLKGVTINDKTVSTSLKNWKDNPLMQLYKRTHTASQDETAGIQELSSTVLEALRPDAIGRELVNIKETTHDAVKIRKRKKGKAVKTNRGTISIQSKGGRNDFITVRPDEEMETSEEWDLNHLEDAEWSVAPEQAEDASNDLMELETSLIMEKLKAITNTESAGKITRQSGGITADNLIEAWGKVKAKNATPDCCVLHTNQLVELMKDDDFKDATLLGEFCDYRRGMVGMFLGMQVYVSNLTPENETYIFDKMRVLYMALRRDRLMIPYELPPHTTGIQISTRYGFEYGDKQSLSQIR